MTNVKAGILRTLFLLATALPICGAYAQTSTQSAIPASQADYQRALDATTKAVITGCASAIEEIKAGRAYIKQLEATRDNQAQEILTLKEKVGVLEAANLAKTKEAEALRASLDASTKALNASTDALKVSMERNAKLEKQVHFWRRTGIGGVLMSAGLIAAKVFL